jgi:hypothetical protein
VHKQPWEREGVAKHAAYQDEVKQCGLIDLHEVQIPRLNFVLRGCRLVVAGLLVIDMVFTVSSIIFFTACDSKATASSTSNISSSELFNFTRFSAMAINTKMMTPRRTYARMHYKPYKKRKTRTRKQI